MRLSTVLALMGISFASSKTTSAGASKFLRRQRSAQATTAQAKEWASRGGGEGNTSEEDSAFWDRVLANHLSIPPTTSPPGPQPPTTPPPEPQPCPVVIDVDCVTVDGSSACTDIPLPESASTADCIVEVEYSYTFKNVGNEVQRIYTLEITRGGETTDITDTIPLTNIQPGQFVIIIQNAEIDICSNADAFDTEAAFVTGPPCDVEVAIACVSEEGDECRNLPSAETPDECLLDITYTYTVTNVGDVDANIILFTRTRNEEFKDLLPLLEETYLPVSQDTAVTETEEIDRCVQQNFATNTIVAQIPNADLLCEDVGFYP